MFKLLYSISGFYRGCIGIMEEKMETIMYRSTSISVYELWSTCRTKADTLCAETHHMTCKGINLVNAITPVYTLLYYGGFHSLFHYPLYNPRIGGMF